MNHPIDFPLTTAQLALREDVNAFAQSELEPIAKEVDQSDDADPRIAERIRNSDLLRYFVPEEYGGAGLFVSNICVIREKLSYWCVSADEFFASQGITVQPIVMWGSEEQRDRYLPDLISGKRLFAFCLTEPTAGSDISGIGTTAKQDGAEWVINGTKRFVYQADVADTFLVFAKTDSDAGIRGISGFLFDSPDEGYRATPYPLLFPAPESELVFDECRVPEDAVLGELGNGARVALSNLDRLRPSVGASAVGMAQRALDEAVNYVQNRQAFGSRLADKQAIRFGLADASTSLEAARSLVYAAASRADAEPEADDIGVSAARAKLFATETAQTIIDTSLQFHGGVGLARGSITERLYRAIRALRIYEGTSEIMRLVVARGLLGKEQR